MAGALTANLIRSYETDKRILSKQLALSTIESIISARNINRPGTIEGWKSIKNLSNDSEYGNEDGIFSSGWRPIRKEHGWDGIAGTPDDACEGSGYCQIPGKPINKSEIMSGFERMIEITNIEDPDRPSPPNPYARRRIDVHVRYYINGIARSEKVSTMITNY